MNTGSINSPWHLWVGMGSFLLTYCYVECYEEHKRVPVTKGISFVPKLHQLPSRGGEGF